MATLSTYYLKTRYPDIGDIAIFDKEDLAKEAFNWAEEIFNFVKEKLSMWYNNFMDQEPIQPLPITAEPVIPPPTPPARKFNPIFILAILVLLSAVGVSGFFLGKSLNNSQKSVLPTATPTPLSRDFEGILRDGETANWKTYTNSEMNFSVNYPSDWTVYDIKEGAAPTDELARIGFSGSVDIVVTKNECSENTAKQCFYDNLLSVNNPNLLVKDFALGMEQALMISVIDYTQMPYGFMGSDRVVITSRKGKNYQILLGVNKTTETKPWPKETYNLFDQILSTFKFLD